MFKYRRSITALRISSHNLEVEVGRYAQKKKGKKEVKVERNKRYCMLCLENNNYLLGDEVHAIGELYTIVWDWVLNLVPDVPDTTLLDLDITLLFQNVFLF